MGTFIKKNWKGLGILLLVAGLILYNTYLYRQGAINKKKAEVAEYNLKVSQDSLKITKDKAGKDEANKLAYLTDKVDNLAKLNQELADEVKQVKGKVSSIVQSEIKIVEKPVPFVVQGELIDSNVYAHFNYDTTYSPGNYRKLSGYTKYSLRTGITSGEKSVDELGVKFTTGIKNLDKGQPEIFLKSDYPGFQVTSLEGAVLDPKLFQPKKKTPLITPNIIVGWTPISLNKNGTTFDTGDFSVGVGIGFNILKLLKLKQ